MSELRLFTIEFIPLIDISIFDKTLVKSKSFKSFETFARLLLIDSILSIELLIWLFFSVSVFSIILDELSIAFIAEVRTFIDSLISEVFSEILGGSQGPLEVGLNYLQGDKSDILDIKTEDRFGVTLSTKISDKILFNGKIGVPIGGIEETLIIGDVQIDFILNDDGSLRAKVFNKENEFRYIGDELGYTQGVGLSYQVDFQTFRDLLSRIISNNK